MESLPNYPSGIFNETLSRQNRFIHARRPLVENKEAFRIFSELVAIESNPNVEHNQKRKF